VTSHQSTVRQPPKGITALGLNKLAASRRKQDLDERPDRGCAGLRVKIRASGRISFRVGYRLAGRQCYLALGNWGDAGTDDHALAALRDRARAIQRLAKTGADPKKQDEARRAEERRREKDTVRAIAEEYRRSHLAKLKTGDQNWRALERLVLPAWGERPIASVTRREIAELTRGICDAGTGYMANRVHSYIAHLFTWCVEQGILEENPAALSRRPLKKEKQRERVLTDDEVAALWRATAGGSPHDRLVRFLLCTASRLGEAAGARSDELENGVWSIPAERSKNGEAYALPLNRPAQAIILEAPPSSPKALLFSYSGARPIGGRSKLKHALDQRVQTELGAPIAWRIHDLRRTAATGMQKCGIAPHVISKVLGHKAAHGAAIVTQVYARYSYEAEKRAAVEAWGERLERIVAGLPVDDGKVVPIRAAAQ
jgi:integrase